MELLLSSEIDLAVSLSARRPGGVRAPPAATLPPELSALSLPFQLNRPALQYPATWVLSLGLSHLSLWSVVLNFALSLQTLGNSLLFFEFLDLFFPFHHLSYSSHVSQAS